MKISRMLLRTGSCEKGKDIVYVANSSTSGRPIPALTDALAALRAEGPQLNTKLTKVRQAIAVLTEPEGSPTRKKAVRP